MIRIGSGTGRDGTDDGRTDAAVRTDRRECRNSYVDISRKYFIVAGSFVCTKCSGMLRGITPPHRIKSMSMSSFTAEEVSFLRSRGNLWCAKVWMGLYDKSRSVAPDSKVRH